MSRPRVTFATPRPVREALATAQEAGKRHSQVDQAALNDAFGALNDAGAVCPDCGAGHVCITIDVG